MTVRARTALGVALCGSVGAVALASGLGAQEPATAPPATGPAAEAQVPAAERSAESGPGPEEPASEPEASPPAAEREPAAAPRTRSPRRFTPSEEVSPDNDVPFPVDI